MTTTQEDPGKETRPVDIKGRSIVVRQLTDAQMLLMAREARLAQKPDTESDRRFLALTRMFDMLESVIVEEEDKGYLLDLTIEGKLGLNDMLTFMSAFQEDEEQPKVRRGRPPKRT